MLDTMTFQVYQDKKKDFIKQVKKIIKNATELEEDIMQGKLVRKNIIEKLKNINDAKNKINDLMEDIK